jgi:hypothetical protein
MPYNATKKNLKRKTPQEPFAYLVGEKYLLENHKEN